MYRLFTLLLLSLSLLSACGSAATSVSSGDLTVTLDSDPAPPLAGRPTELLLAVTAGDAPLNDATVALRRSMPGMTHDTDDDLIDAQPLGAGRYQVSTEFSMGGRWDVTVVVQRSDGSEQSVVMPLTLEQP